MHWLLDTELPVYDWSNSSSSSTPSEVLVALDPAASYMNSASNIATSVPGVSILPPLTYHSTLASPSQQWNTDGTDIILQSDFSRPVLTQTVYQNLKPDSEISKETCNSHGSGGGVGKRRGGGGGKEEGVGGSSDMERLVRRREQNRRAAVNCRRRKKERATNSLLEYQKFQCSNTELRNNIRHLTETRKCLLQQLTSLCQPCANLVTPLPTPDTQDCED